MKIKLILEKKRYGCHLENLVMLTSLEQKVILIHINTIVLDMST